MQNGTFKNIVCKTSYKLPATNKYPNDDRLFTTTNELLVINNNNRKDNYYYKYAIGIKTGFTTPAKNCLISAANKDGLELLTVILGASQDSDGLSQRYLETKKLFNFGYDTYSLKKVVNSGDIVQTINISHATRDTKKLDIVLEKDISVLIKNKNINSNVLPVINLNENLKAPIKKDVVVGNISYTVEGITYQANLLANSNVKKSKALLHILEIFIILFLLYLLLQYRKKMRKNRRIKTYYQKIKGN